MTLNLKDEDQGDIVIIAASGLELVRIQRDGTLTYGADYTPDEAARAFWEALAQYR